MLQARAWVPEGPEQYMQTLAKRFASQTTAQNERDLLAFVEENRVIHERDCFNLNPATNASARLQRDDHGNFRIHGHDRNRSNTPPDAVSCLGI